MGKLKENQDETLAKIDEFFDSEENVERMKAYFQKIKDQEKIHKKQLKRFHENHSGRFAEIIEKVMDKYGSNAYVRSWYRRGIEPPRSLYFFFYDYASKYGRKATRKEMVKYGNDFTAGLYYANGYFFNLMNGQGTAVLVEKEAA